MKKLVLRTVGITLMAVLVLSAVTLAFLSMFSPLTLAHASEKVGLKDLSIKYYVRQYESSNSQNDLATLIYKLDQEDDAKECAKYCLIFINGDGFENFCSSQNEGIKYHGSAENAHEYFYIKSVISSFNSSVDGFEGALLHCRIYLNSYGYTDLNPLRVLIAQKNAVLTAEQRTGIVSLIDNYNPKSAEEAIRIAQDKQDINQINQ